MPELLCLDKVILLLYLLIIVATVSSVSYPHYTNYSMESERICHPLESKQSNKLGDADDAGVIVLPKSVFDSWNPSRDKLCKYVFKTHRHTGLFAVIQKMYLRRNASGCIDYVQLIEGGHKSKFCGEMDYSQMSFHSMLYIDESTKFFSDSIRRNSSPPEVKSSKGEIETRIFISKQRLQPGETLDILIVYTPYKDCDKLKDRSKYRANSNNTCISASYYCDGRRNCAFDSCLDEANCETVVSNGTGTKVTVGAVTTLFLSFLLFVMCLWTCRKHKKLCWSPDCAGPNIAGTNSQSIDMRTRTSSGRSVVPSAPMLDEASSRPVHDKDLPPSYDSLFPDQPVPAATPNS